ncbi:MAG: CehA/McbA family metallohydrolase [Chloroflexi bacterium]|nr:CehA/McbA family metallohydrolase [Chloroflexota bacterium]
MRQDQPSLSGRVTNLEGAVTRLRRFVDGTYAHLMGRQVDNLRERWRRTQELLPQPIRRIDLHSHTLHSDGSGTVAEMDAWRQRAGLDALAITDHNTLAHASDCSRFSQILIGEEVTGQHHHVLVHQPPEVLQPVHQLAGEVTLIRSRGRVPLVAHPSGWMGRSYESERINAVKELDGLFLIEIANGAGNWYDYRDSTDEMARGLWDELLLAQKLVVATGNSDAHRPANVGLVWNGVTGVASEPVAIYEALLGGAGFVSDGPAAFLAADGVAAALTPLAENATVLLQLEAADSAGLAHWRIVAGGCTWREGDLEGRRHWRHELEAPGRGVGSYRLEIVSEDGREAFTNPVRFGAALGALDQQGLHARGLKPAVDVLA